MIVVIFGIKSIPAPVAVIFYPEPTENHSIRFKSEGSARDKERSNDFSVLDLGKCVVFANSEPICFLSFIKNVIYFLN